MQARIDLDAWYVEHAGLGLDLWILARTPLEVLRQRNAA
jgi:lipopolysaccharide/colanic/teichoic acid biosynthesis glycosyltransferase